MCLTIPFLRLPGASVTCLTNKEVHSAPQVLMMGARELACGSKALVILTWPNWRVSVGEKLR